MSDGRRILVCDDEPQILRALRVILRDAGFEVITAASAEEALDTSAVRPLDAAILDLVLPDGDGAEVTRSIREWSEMPILVLSAVGEEAEKIRALDAGADDYVTKPFGPGELVARLNAVLRRAGGIGTSRGSSSTGSSSIGGSLCGAGREADPSHSDRVRASPDARPWPRTPYDSLHPPARGMGASLRG